MTPARHLWTLFEPLHAVTYFTPEGRAAFEAAGLRGFWRGYFAGRSSPLGRAPAAVTTALYANFAPRMVERAIPSIWDLATPEAALEARLSGAVAALERLLGGLPGVEEAADLLREVASGAPTSGRALGAANAALPWPDEPIGVLWQAATTLRELRGDGHVAGQLAVGLSGLDTMVLRCGHDMTREALQPARGWTDEEWDAGVAAIVERGLLGEDGRITADGSRGDGGGRGGHRPAGPGAVGRGRPRPDRPVRRAGDAADAGRPHGAARRHAARAARAVGAALAQQRDDGVRRRERRDQDEQADQRQQDRRRRGVPASRPGP